MNELKSIESQALQALESVTSIPELDQWKSTHLGKKSSLMGVLKGMKDATPEMRKEMGAEANRIKKGLGASWEKRRQEISEAEVNARLEKEWLDITLPLSHDEQGHLHPITRYSRKIEDIFTKMGFKVLEGPLVEDDWHNFEALNIPPEHPARDMQDTFFMTNGSLLRTHTSSVQIRTMEKIQPPFRGIAPGRVFRNEEVDACHDNTFYQVEGILIDKDISVANMKYFLRTMLREIFEKDVEVRLRHGYFPFVEPGFELDLRCLLCEGKGCPACKHVGWSELMGCGMVHPKVLEACNIDPEVWGGFAFGMGLNRLVMNHYDIDNIRHFVSGDLRFVQQLN
ncbi:MAG: phenylalanine--tRNA ligase subunit alpha [Planctomycetes bacterium]|nr:phenylalanine--tRNA ligase subunit alpha [Planctomycetota bacterium]